MRKLGLSALLLLLLMTASSRAQKTPATKDRRPVASSAWVETTLKKMTLRQKLGQMLMPYYFGAFTSTDSAEYKELLHQVEANDVGGFILGTIRGPLGIERSQVYPSAVLTNELQRHAKIPLLIGADFESGAGMRIDEGTSFPSAMAVGATNDPKLAYTMGKVTALEARAAGVQWIFAPDSDVNNNPDNPIINIRSFGEDPQRVAEYVAQFVRGAEENGALATAKHFPGHGDVSVDSHLALAAVPGDRAELEGTELVPFRAAIAAGVSSIMPGHLSVRAFEPDPTVPATFSKSILTGLLRDEMKFKGLIVTDALDMGGVTSLAPGEAVVRAVEAGADVLLQPPVPDAAMAGLEEALKSGRISEKRIDESVRRILLAKSRVGLDKDRLVDITRISEKFARPEFEAQAQSIADRGVTLLRDTPHILPLDSTRPLRVLLVSLSSDPDPYPGETIEPEIRWRVDSLKALRADTQFSSVSSLALPPPDTYDVAIAALFVRVADRKGNVGMPEDQRAFVNQFLATTSKPTVVMSFGSPYLIEKFPAAKTWLAEFATNDVSQRAAVRALFGQTAIAGKIPVTVPGTVKRGDGLSVAANPMTLEPAPAAMSARLKPAFDVLDRAVADGAFPGGVVAIGLHDQLVVHPFGKLTRDAKSPNVTPDTIYDMASLTKVIVTTTSVMMLIQQKRLDLDAPAIRYIPELAAAAKSDPDPAWRARITVRNLLLHDSGLPAHRDFYKDAKGYDAVLARVIAEPLVHEPGKQVEYSDLGFILLGEIVQRLTGVTLDAYAKQHIFAPLGMDHSTFNPPRALRAKIAPTEFDADFRKRLLQGEVHDENSWAMGGVAGDAGLFSTAGDAAAFAQMILNGGIYAYHRLLTRAIIDQFTARQPVGDSARALGWDVITQPSSSGHDFSPISFGHTGFTGTSLWIDPERGLFVLLLTNRVNPTRANEKIRQVRPALHDAVMESLGLANQPAPAR
jgi:beta-N-acetylhexosaminidase